MEKRRKKEKNLLTPQTAFSIIDSGETIPTKKEDFQPTGKREGSPNRRQASNLPQPQAAL